MNNYDRIKATNYALFWWNKRNPKYYNFNKLGGDCTNFISQCLYAGGIRFNQNQNGWYYHSISNRSPSWSGVNEFFNFAINNNSQLGPRAKITHINKIEIGDIVQGAYNNTFQHSLIITKIIEPISLSSIFVTCHSDDRINKRLSDYNFSKIRFLKILN